MSLSKTTTAGLLLAGAFALQGVASESGAVALEKSFVGKVRPFVETYCVDCHSGEKPKAQFDITVYATMDSVIRDYERRQLVLERLQSAEMPPEKAKHKPTPEFRQNVIDWIQGFLRHEAQQNAGDPGPVLARRSNGREAGSPRRWGRAAREDLRKGKPHHMLLCST